MTACRSVAADVRGPATHGVRGLRRRRRGRSPPTVAAAAPARPAQTRRRSTTGTGSAVALGYKVNPIAGSLSLRHRRRRVARRPPEHRRPPPSPAPSTSASSASPSPARAATAATPPCRRSSSPSPCIDSSRGRAPTQGSHGPTPAASSRSSSGPPTQPFAEAITDDRPARRSPASLDIAGGRHARTTSGVRRRRTARPSAVTEIGDVNLAGGVVEAHRACAGRRSTAPAPTTSTTARSPSAALERSA